MAELIDVNSADVETLASLPGIGRKRAAEIVAYRTEVHPFEELIELTAVPGISERMVREWSDRLTVNGAGSDGTTAPAEDDAPELELSVIDAGDLVTNDSLMAPVVAAYEAEEPVEPDPEMTADSDDQPVVVTMLHETQEEAENDETPETVQTEREPTTAERPAVEYVQRRHFHFWQQFFGILLGAVGGSLLTLLLLYLLNGTLRFASDARTTDLQLQLDEDTSTILQSQSSMADEMGELTGRVAELDNDLAASEGAIGAVEAAVSSLEDETAAINEQLETIDLAAEKFDTFLTGLRDLLFALQGAPPTATTTITGTAPATLSATLSATAAAEDTAEIPTMTPPAETPEAGAPTRTPRPTATPLIEDGN